MPEGSQRRVANRYHLLSRLGRGGMGVVWLADDLTLQRRVAIKELVIPPGLSEAEQASMRARVSREARAAARLNHPNVITIFDVVNDAGNSWIVMEYVDAPTLTEVVEGEGPLVTRRAAAVGLDLLSALDTAHSEGIIHRDVKPSNVMVSRSGRVKLADFGVAVLQGDPKITTTGLIVGSPSYMSPEQARESGSGPASDLWGLGATLYYAVEGVPPFERGQALATLQAVTNDPPRPMRTTGPLTEVIAELLAKDPRQRPSASELEARLRDVSAGGAMPPPAPGPLMTGGRTSRGPEDKAAGERGDSATLAPAGRARPVADSRRRGATALVVAGVLALLAFAGWTAVRELGGDTRLAQGGEVPGPVPTGDRATAPAAGREQDPAPSRPTEAEPAEAEPTQAPPTQPEATERPPTDGPSPDDPTGGVPDLPDESPAVPAGWRRFDGVGPSGTAIALPPGWTVRDRPGNATDLVDPDTGTYLRVDWSDQPKPDPVADWRAQSPIFGSGKADYEEIRIEPVEYRDYTAGLWEYTYSEGGSQLHAYNLGLVAGDHGYALNFQTRAENWSSSQELFEQLLRAFDPVV